MDKQAYHLLKIISKYKEVHISSLIKLLNKDKDEIYDYFEHLTDVGYIGVVPNVNTEYDKSIDEEVYITTAGKIVLNNHLKDKHIMFLKELRNWFSLLIALAAFIKSFFF